MMKEGYGRGREKDNQEDVWCGFWTEERRKVRLASDMKKFRKVQKEYKEK